nr:splicing factor [Tanacetum cinerariifolium]
MMQQQYELDRKVKMEVIEREANARVNLYNSQKICEDLYVQGELKQITDIKFEGMSFNHFRDIVSHLVLGIVKRLYYCSFKSELNVGIKELKTEKDVEDFLRVGYENKWFVNLYTEHFDYDVVDFLNDEANVNETPYESSDECYSSDEVEELDYVDFHTKGGENVVIKNLTTKTLS